MRALLIIDMENDFMPTGALPVLNADEIIPLINRLSSRFSLVLAIQDRHPANHITFATNHPLKKPGDVLTTQWGEQILWPTHCVYNTFGAELVAGLNQENIARYFYKGVDQNIESYSAFFDNHRLKSTALSDYLLSHGVNTVYLVGVTTEYCVLHSALDALELGFCTYVIIDACRPLNIKPGDEEIALQQIVAKGGKLISSQELLQKSDETQIL